MGPKRTHAEMSGQKQDPNARPSPFMPMFETFRAELDEHHERRERIIKASRDITASSKKIIFTLQRCKTLKQPLPQHVVKGNQPLHDTISTRFRDVAADLQGLNSYRYARQISGGCQEWMEAASFQHYLVHAELLGYEEARRLMWEVSSKELENGEKAGVDLSPEDWVLGIYDMTGELMRFAITNMGAERGVPTIPSTAQANGDAMDVDSKPAASQRNVLTDMRVLRSALESVDAGQGPFARDAEKKMEVMRQSVEKVEKSLYGLIVRGAERPKGWVPDTNEGRTIEVEG